MSIIHKIHNLPVELQNKIYNMFWMQKYDEHVISHFKMLNNYHSRIHNFLNNHFLATRVHLYDTLHYSFLEEINKMLYKIINDKSSYLYLIGKDITIKVLRIYNDPFYHCNIHISSNILLVAIFSMKLSKNRYISYDTFERFKKLSAYNDNNDNNDTNNNNNNKRVYCVI